MAIKRRRAIATECGFNRLNMVVPYLSAEISGIMGASKYQDTSNHLLPGAGCVRDGWLSPLF
jgi:hypothetical protein